eukprot:11222922-Alexandrium_andersonii.AAC.1
MTVARCHRFPPLVDHIRQTPFVASQGKGACAAPLALRCAPPSAFQSNSSFSVRGVLPECASAAAADDGGSRREWSGATQPWASDQFRQSVRGASRRR